MLTNHSTFIRPLFILLLLLFNYNNASTQHNTITQAEDDPNIKITHSKENQQSTYSISATLPPSHDMNSNTINLLEYLKSKLTHPQSINYVSSIQSVSKPILHGINTLTKLHFDTIIHDTLDWQHSIEAIESVYISVLQRTQEILNTKKNPSIDENTKQIQNSFSFGKKILLTYYSAHYAVHAHLPLRELETLYLCNYSVLKDIKTSPCPQIMYDWIKLVLAKSFLIHIIHIIHKIEQVQIVEKNQASADSAVPNDFQAVSSFTQHIAQNRAFFLEFEPYIQHLHKEILDEYLNRNTPHLPQKNNLEDNLELESHDHPEVPSPKSSSKAQSASHKTPMELFEWVLNTFEQNKPILDQRRHSIDLWKISQLWSEAVNKIDTSLSATSIQSQLELIQKGQPENQSSNDTNPLDPYMFSKFHIDTKIKDYLGTFYHGQHDFDEYLKAIEGRIRRNEELPIILQAFSKNSTGFLDDLHTDLLYFQEYIFFKNQVTDTMHTLFYKSMETYAELMYSILMLNTLTLVLLQQPDDTELANRYKNVLVQTRDLYYHLEAYWVVLNEKLFNAGIIPSAFSWLNVIFVFSIAGMGIFLFLLVATPKKKQAILGLVLFILVSVFLLVYQYAIPTHTTENSTTIHYESLYNTWVGENIQIFEKQDSIQDSIQDNIYEK